MKNIAVLASHNGSALSVLHEASLKNVLNIKIALVISNNSNAPVLQNADRYAIMNHLVNSKTSENPEEKIYSLLKEYNCEYIFLAGYMKKLPPEITNNFKVINSHPSLLPKYGGIGMYGKFVHEAVIKNKEKISGVTIHEVNEVYDEGKILLQKELNLCDEETAESLEKKIKELEKIAILEALREYIN